MQFQIEMMNSGSIKKNVIYQTTADVLSMILPLIASPYISRVIGAEGLGTYSFYYSVAYYFTLIAALGIRNHGSRTIAKSKNDHQKINISFSNLYAIQLISSLICIAFYILFILSQCGYSSKFYATIMLFQVISSLFDISWLYIGLEEFRLTVTVGVTVKLVSFIALFICIKSREDIWIYLLIMSLSVLFNQVALWIPLKKYVSFAKPSISIMASHIKPLFILFLPTIAVSLYKYMDKIMIGVMSNKTQLGFYENAEKVTLLPLTIISSFGTVMIPRISNMIATSKNDNAIKYTQLSSKYIMWLSYALSFGFAATANVFAPVYWGAEFTLCGSLIMYLSSTIPFISFANIIRTQYLIPYERDLDYVFSVSAGAIVNLAINYCLIPRLGAAGAAAATIAAEITVCLIQCVSSRRNLPIGIMFKQTIPFVLFAIIMFAIVFTIGKKMPIGIPSLGLQIITGMGFYCTTSFLYLYKKQDPMLLSMFSLFQSNNKHP